jgi:hypothetical protein
MNSQARKLKESNVEMASKSHSRRQLEIKKITLKRDLKPTYLRSIEVTVDSKIFIIDLMHQQLPKTKLK